MVFLLLGLVLIVAKLAGWGPVADWAWWWVLSPFAAAAAWWSFADSSGLTQRRVMNKMEERKRDRREKAMAALGLSADAQARRGSSAPRPPAAGSPPAAPESPPRRDSRS